MEKVTDNMKTSFPSRMSDGRFITNYHPNCMMNAGFQKICLHGNIKCI